MNLVLLIQNLTGVLVAGLSAEPTAASRESGRTIDAQSTGQILDAAQHSTALDSLSTILRCLLLIRFKQIGRKVLDVLLSPLQMDVRLAVMPIIWVLKIKTN